jgi:peptidoglycan-N-acetylglucosamine deacetylase
MTVPPDEGGEGPAPPVLHLVHDGGSRLALTFDGATSANGTAELLELLRELDLEVTMFVTGEFIDRHPAIVRQAALAGHEFGNHTYSHPRLTTYATNRRHDLLPGVTRESLHRELERTEEAFRAATGRSLAPLWRAPYGEENRQLRAWAMELGYLHCRWSSLQGASLDSLDWVEDEHSALYVESDRLIERLLAFPRLEGGIVLMHLSTNRRVPPWTDLPRFADEVRRRGVQIGTVSALLEASAEWRPWYQRARARHDELSVRSAAR